MKLYIARHGETAWNAENRVSGRTDVPLTERGLQQAQELAKNAMGKGIEVIIASPLLRARQSAFQLAHRVYSALEDVKRKFGGKTVLLVCHGGVCRMVRSYFMDLTNDEYSYYFAPNAELVEYEL